MDERAVATKVVRQYWGGLYEKANFSEAQIDEHVEKWMRKMEAAEKERVIWDEVKRELGKDKDNKIDIPEGTTKCGAADCVIL